MEDKQPQTVWQPTVEDQADLEGMERWVTETVAVAADVEGDTSGDEWHPSTLNFRDEGRVSLEAQAAAGIEPQPQFINQPGQPGYQAQILQQDSPLQQIEQTQHVPQPQAMQTAQTAPMPTDPEDYAPLFSSAKMRRALQNSRQNGGDKAGLAQQGFQQPYQQSAVPQGQYSQPNYQQPQQPACQDPYQQSSVPQGQYSQPNQPACQEPYQQCSAPQGHYSQPNHQQPRQQDCQEPYQQRSAPQGQHS